MRELIGGSSIQVHRRAFSSKSECTHLLWLILSPRDFTAHESLAVGADRICAHYSRAFMGDNRFRLSCPPPQLNNLTEIHDQISGMARCPYSPQHNSTALLTPGGELYAATAMDFPGRDPAIYRSLGILPPLRTAQYNSKWLNGESSGRCRSPTSFVCNAWLLVLNSTLSHFQRKTISKEIKMSPVLCVCVEGHLCGALSE